MLFLISAPVEAPSFQITDSYAFHEVSLHWSNISRTVARGEVLGYRIKFWPIEQNDLPVFNRELSYIDVFEPNRSLTIKKLLPYTTYGVQISAFTEGGFGVFSGYKVAGESTNAVFRLTASYMKFLKCFPLFDNDNFNLRLLT